MLEEGCDGGNASPEAAGRSEHGVFARSLNFGFVGVVTAVGVANAGVVPSVAMAAKLLLGW